MPPQYGSLILESPQASDEIDGLVHARTRLITHSNFYVHQFTQLDISNEALQYMHGGNSEEKPDRLVFNVSAGSAQIGPKTLPIRVVRNQVQFLLESTM